MSRYKQITDGVPVTLPMRTALGVKGGSLYFTCCDCGLVHSIVVIPLRTRIKLYFWRDNRRTGQRRRWWKDPK